MYAFYLSNDSHNEYHDYLALMTLQVQLELDRARAEDPTVFEYDSVYDELENRKIARKSAVIDDKKVYD